MDAYELFAILLLAVGVGLLVIEVFIPSGGLILILSLVCLSVSVWCSVKAWWNSEDMLAWWTYLAALVVLIPGAVSGAFYMLPRTEFGRSILATPPELEDVTPYVEEEEHLKQMIGKLGTTLSLMNPGGLVSVNSERMHCEAEGMLIESGETVEVIAVKGNRLVVRHTPDASGSTEVASTNDSPDAEDSPLDFDVPQG